MKTIGKYFYSGVLILVSVAVLGVPIVGSYAAEPIRVRIFIEKGSVWDSPKGRELIKQETAEAHRIWVGKVGLNLDFDPKISFTSLRVSTGSLLKEDIQRYAVTHKADVRNIVVVYTNSSYPRGYADDSLVKANTPVILVGKQVYDKPGTKRMFAHELGHVLLRDPDHVWYDTSPFRSPSDWTKGDNLMSQKVDCGDLLNSGQIKRARRYLPDAFVRLTTSSWAGTWECTGPGTYTGSAKSGSTPRLTIKGSGWSSKLEAKYEVAYGGNPAEDKYTITSLKKSKAGGTYIYSDDNPREGKKPGVPGDGEWPGTWEIKLREDGTIKLTRRDKDTLWEGSYICKRCLRRNDN